MFGQHASRAIEENDHNESADISNRTFSKLEKGARKASSNPSPPSVDSHAVDSKLHAIRLAMVNNAKRSDIVFLVGKTVPVKIHAHTPILMMHSEVFDSMFSGDFEISTEIDVTDMEPDIFLQLLNFIYAGMSAVMLTTGNMIDLLYGAQKYMLQALKKACEDFILANTNTNNLLEVYNASQCFENAVIKEMCFSVILDNPLRFFNEKAFDDLNSLAIKELMGQKKINCSDEQLHHFILQWQRRQVPDEELTDAAAYERLETVTGVTASSFTNKQFFNIKLESFGKFATAMFQLNRTVCNLNRCTDDGSKFLHGIGVYTGVELFGTHETVTISLMERDSVEKSWFHLKTVIAPVTQHRTLSAACFMFEKIQVQRHLLIGIDFGSYKSRYCLRKTCDKPHDHFKSGCEMFSYEEDVMVKVPYTCVAYLLTSDGPKIDQPTNSTTKNPCAFQFTAT